MGNAFAKRRREKEQKKRNVDPGTDATKDSAILSAEDIVLKDGLDECQCPSDQIDIALYEYPFENIVFEGGGTKGLAYCGAIQVLEELRITQNIKRIAGTSAGAITAGFLAVGYSSEDIRGFMDEDMAGVMLDHSCGYLSLLPNLIRHFGWNPAKCFLDWYGQKLEDIGDDPNITFYQVLKKHKKELCIVVTNVNMMTTEYFHPKTTPNVSIREAVRMSMAIPVYFQALRRDIFDCGQQDTYVDGGMLCNYPIQCFDGWWLSMEPKDCFLQKLNKLEELPRMFENKTRFGTNKNKKTMGFLLYAEDEQDLLRVTLERRRGAGCTEIPDTKLGRKYRVKLEKKQQEQKSVNGKRGDLDTAIQAFFNALPVDPQRCSTTINLEMLRQALDHEGFKNHKEFLFGKNATAETIMNAMDGDKSKTIDYAELDHYFGQKGYSLTSTLLGYKRTDVTHFFSFLKAVEDTLLHNVQRLNVEEEDAKRTVGINTGYIGTTDFVLEADDKKYMIEQGRKSTEVFLREFIKENNLPVKRPFSSAQPSEVSNGMNEDGIEKAEPTDTPKKHEVEVSIEHITSNDIVTNDQIDGNETDTMKIDETDQNEADTVQNDRTNENEEDIMKSDQTDGSETGDNDRGLKEFNAEQYTHNDNPSTTSVGDKEMLATCNGDEHSVPYKTDVNEKSHVSEVIANGVVVNGQTDVSEV